MKKEEAIELLEDLIGFVEDNQGRDYDTAFRMAIEALQDTQGAKTTTELWSTCYAKYWKGDVE